MSDGSSYQRDRMIRLLEARGVRNARVLEAMRQVPRHLFVPRGVRPNAYADRPVPIGYGQTISQPYVVARMIEALLQDRRRKLGRVLEVGTGCGYQAAVLAQLADEVYSVERILGLLERARANLLGLKLSKLRLAHGDGNDGLAKAAPFDSIIVAAAAAKVPQGLLLQLAMGGRMILPLKSPGAGRDAQRLILIERSSRGYAETELDPVRFVPLEMGKA